MFNAIKKAITKHNHLKSKLPKNNYLLLILKFKTMNYCIDIDEMSTKWVYNVCNALQVGLRNAAEDSRCDNMTAQNGRGENLIQTTSLCSDSEIPKPRQSQAQLRAACWLVEYICKVHKGQENAQLKNKIYKGKPLHASWANPVTPRSKTFDHSRLTV